MINFRFSIIIPTRQRHETLGAAIKTVLNQNFKNYEIIISDNCSTPDTKKVVDSFNSDKIKYIRSDVALAMVDNWEEAISHASGEYIILFGDDDGLIAGALNHLNTIIESTKYSLIQWERVYYSWPNIEPAIYANFVHLKFEKPHYEINGPRLIEDVIQLREDYTKLPMLYNSAVHYSLINDFKKKTGRFFHATIPDVFSGFALAFLSDKFLSLGIPMSINGGSLKSNGTSFFFKKSADKVNDDFKTLNDKSKVFFDESIPLVRSIPMAVIEPYIKFFKLIQKDKFIFDYLNAYKSIIKNLVCYDQEEFDQFRIEILSKAKAINLNSDILENEFTNVSLRKIESIYPPKIGFTNSELILDSSKFDINDVYGISIFSEKFYDYNGKFTNINKEEKMNQKIVQKIGIKSRIKKALKLLIYGKY